MAYKDTEIEKLTDGRLIYNDKLFIANCGLIQSIYDFDINDSNKKLLKLTLEILYEYLDTLKQFNNTILDKILKDFLYTEVVDNQVVEFENIDLLRTYMSNDHVYAINYLLAIMKKYKKLSANAFLKCHEILMRGTQNYASNGLRVDNNSFVMFNKDGIDIIRYLPISYDEIVDAINVFIDYYNSENYYIGDVFIKPFFIHLLIAAFQFFYDGNARLGRTLSSIKFHNILKSTTNYDFDMPALYYSKQFIPCYDEYRNLIYKFVSNPGDDSLNEWVKFNLNRVMDQVYCNEEKLERSAF